MNFVDITAEDLLKLREGLSILERLGSGILEDFTFYIYGITSNVGILDAAKESIAANAEQEIPEENIQITEIAVAIPASSDTLYYLTGSGLKLGKNDEFVYAGASGEGVRSLGFGYSTYRPTASARDFSHIALADSEVWLDKFYSQYGNKQPVAVKPEINRTPGSTSTPQQKQTSVRLSTFVEEFLGN